MANISFLPTTTAEAIVLPAAFAVGALLVCLVFRIASPMNVRDAKITDDYQVQLITWERDRVMSAAKGVAASSSGFILALAIALLKDEVLADVSALSILGCLLGAIGALMLSAQLSIAAARFTLADKPSAPAPQADDANFPPCI